MQNAILTETLIKDALRGLSPRAMHRVLFNLADTYNQAAELSLAQISSTGNADYAAPAIMCRGFAVELLLKFFIVVRHPSVRSKADLDALGINLRGHPYSSLFDRIDVPLQESIAQKYSERSGTSTDAAGFRSVLISLGDSPFVDWRYVYESSDRMHLDIAKLSVVVDSLGLAAQDETRRAEAKGPDNQDTPQ